jgi:hypothetical protein
MSNVSQINPMKGKRKSYLLHINEDLWNELNEWAGQEFRSVNGQIEYLLRQAVNERKERRRGNKDEDFE